MKSKEKTKIQNQEKTKFERAALVSKMSFDHALIKLGVHLKI